MYCTWQHGRNPLTEETHRKSKLLRRGEKTGTGIYRLFFPSGEKGEKAVFARSAQHKRMRKTKPHFFSQDFKPPPLLRGAFDFTGRSPSFLLRYKYQQQWRAGDCDRTTARARKIVILHRPGASRTVTVVKCSFSCSIQHT